MSCASLQRAAGQQPNQYQTMQLNEKGQDVSSDRSPLQPQCNQSSSPSVRGRIHSSSFPPTHSLTYLGGAVGASLVGGLLAQLADGIVGTLGGLPAGGRRRAEATTAAAPAAASGLGQHLAVGRFVPFPLLVICFSSLVSSFIFKNEREDRRTRMLLLMYVLLFSCMNSTSTGTGRRYC